MNDPQKRINIKKEHIQDVLRGFGIGGQLLTFRNVTDWQEERGKERAVRIVTEVKLVSGEHLAIRFLNERQFILDVSRLVLTTQVIERQSQFSEILREQGILVPTKYSYQGQYCMPYEIEGMSLDVTAESWLEGGKKVFSPEFFGKFGELLGQIHQVSQESQMKIGFSIVYDEVEKGAMDFRKIFGNMDLSAFPEKIMCRIEMLHDQKKKSIADIWPKLPRGAVQGDIYSCNNLVWKEDGRVGLFDFNIAADEVFLGDLLHAWYRTIYDSNNAGVLDAWNLETCWQDYINGYETYRRLTALEREWMNPVSSLLEAIYAARLAAEYLRKDDRGKANAQIDQVLKILER